jgi:hypothetical protein
MLSYLLPSENNNDDQKTIHQQTIIARRVRHVCPFPSCLPPRLSGDARCLLLLPGSFSSVTQSIFHYCAFARFTRRHSTPGCPDLPSRKTITAFLFLFFDSGDTF